MDISFTQSLRLASNYLVEQRGKYMLLVVDAKTIQGEQHASWLEDILWLHRIGIKLVVVPDLTCHQNNAVTSTTIEQLLSQTQQLFRVFQAGLHRYSTASELIQVELIRCLPMGVINGVDFEMMGRVSHVQHKKLNELLNNHWIVWQAPLGFSPSGQSYTITTEEAVAQLARHIQAEKVIYLTQESVLPVKKLAHTHELSVHELQQLLPNHHRCRQLLHLFKQGIKRIHLLDSQVDGTVIEELFSRDGAGVMIHNDGYDQLKPANEQHIQGILDLIEPYQHTQAILPRTQELLDSCIDHYWVMTRDHVVIGCIAMHPLTMNDRQPKAFELACLVVEKEYQNRGLANRLLEKMIEQAQKMQAKQLFTLTTQAKNWFLRKGFELTDLSSLPESRQTTYNYHRNSVILCRKI